MGGFTLGGYYFPYEFFGALAIAAAGLWLVYRHKAGRVELLNLGMAEELLGGYWRTDLLDKHSNASLRGSFGGRGVTLRIGNELDFSSLFSLKYRIDLEMEPNSVPKKIPFSMLFPQVAPGFKLAGDRVTGSLSLGAPASNPALLRAFLESAAGACATVERGDYGDDAPPQS